MQIRRTLTIEDFKQMEAMEKEYYSTDFIADYHDAYDWYNVLSFTTMAIEDQGKIIGFMDLFPVTAPIFGLIKRGVFNDKNLKTHDIIDLHKAKTGCFNLFLSCVVIDRNYRGTQALKILLESYVDFYNGYASQGIEFDEIITDNVTHEGERFSERLGFKMLLESDHKTVVYCQKYRDFIEAVNRL